MDWGIIGIGISIVSIGIAVLANRQSKQANELSKKSNDIAVEALNAAAEANKISEDANDLSQEANSLIKTQVLQNSDDSFVRWECQWNEVEACFILKNLGRDNAFHVAVVIADKDFHKVIDWPIVEKGQVGVTIPLPEIVSERIEYNEKAIISQKRAAASGIFGAAIMFRRKFNLVITWKSTTGVPGQFSVDVTVR